MKSQCNAGILVPPNVTVLTHPSNQQSSDCQKNKIKTVYHLSRWLISNDQLDQSPLTKSKPLNPSTKCGTYSEKSISQRFLCSWSWNQWKPRTGRSDHVKLSSCVTLSFLQLWRMNFVVLANPGSHDLLGWRGSVPGPKSCYSVWPTARNSQYTARWRLLWA